MEFHNRRVMILPMTMVSMMILVILLFNASASFSYPSLAVAAAPQDGLSNDQPDIGSSEVLAEVIPSESSCLVSPSYPESIRQWCDSISRYSALHGLSPDLIAALIWQESGGNPQAYSKSGAVGLMQVMPSDGLAASFNCVNGPCFASRPTIQELQDPEFNIAFGTKYLAQQITRQGDLRSALKAYGPMNVGFSYADKVLAIYETYRSQN